MFNLKKGIIVSILGIMTVCSAGLAYGFANADSTNEFFSLGELNETYYVGDFLKIPEGKFGEEKAETFLHCPDGTVYKTTEKLIETYGTYKVVYNATISGAQYSHEETFETIAKVNSFSGENSTVSYGMDEKSGKEGLLIGLAGGETYRYNDIIDMYSTSELNPAISMTFAPSIEGNWDATEIYLSFIDIYDASNKVEIWIRLKEEIVSNVVAKASNQNWGAYVWWGDTYTLKINSNEGTQIYAGNSVHAGGLNNMDVFKNQRLEFWLDDETKQLYVGTRKAFGWNTDFVVLDLDNSEEQTYPWAGFTTGEAYLEISCKNYTSNHANLVVTKLAGNDLTKEMIDDTVGPEIQIQENDFELENLPQGLKGASYPIFDAVSMDKYSGTLATDVRVFFGYERSNGVYQTYGSRYVYEVPIKENRFLAENVGTYAIVYRSKDYVGNYTERVITVEVDENVYAPLSEVVIEDKIESIEAGNILNLAKLSSYGGGVHPLTINYSVQMNGQSISLFGNEYDGYWFIPQESGQCIVTITVSDFIGNNKSVEYLVEVTETTKTVFSQAPILPKYFLEGMKYSLPALTASKNGQNTDTKIKIVDGNGEREYSNETVFKADANGCVELIYYTEDNQISYTRPVVAVVNNTGLDITQYFAIKGDVAVGANSVGVNMHFRNEGEAEFIREILVYDLQFGFNLLNFAKGKISFYLTDYINPTESIKISFVGLGDKIEILCNDKKTNQVIDITTNGITPITVKYDYDAKAITIGGGIAIALPENRFGTEFGNFASDSCYLRFEAEEVESEFAVEVMNIRSQWLNQYVQSDVIAPELHLYGDYGSMVYSVGDILTTIPACYNDVLDPSVKGTITVSFDGEILKTLDGLKINKLSCLESYQTKLERLGTYIVSYKIVDGAGKEFVLAYKVIVIDNVAPILQINDKIPEKLSLGNYKIPDFTATDETSNILETYITLTTPQGKVMLIQPGIVNLSLQGQYLLSYFALDENGNVARKNFYIQVN